jgi:hypothetical protein
MKIIHNRAALADGMVKESGDFFEDPTLFLRSWFE